MAKQREQAVQLKNQVQALEEELAQLHSNNQIIWGLLVQIGNRLQRSSTAIKTAVSSLLDYDIFWDEATQYEFLQAIDNSNDELANFIVLITLAFRSQSQTLEINIEPNVLQEILATLQISLAKNNPQIQFDIRYPSVGRPALVDYHYLLLALSLVAEVILSEEKEKVVFSVIATEDIEYWRLQLSHQNSSLINIIRQFLEQADDIASIVDKILPENALKLMTACRILHLQRITLCQQTPSSEPPSVCIQIPIDIKSVQHEQL
ncbi:MAG: hypothetical protein CSA11_07960 [Chloroflexi bacterium]|nr:MAG: hypothetical protein CSA11_07960 [Chloroflexota bacterium]